KHEAEVLPALQRRRHGIGQAGGAEKIAERPLEDEGETEGEQQPVEMVELIEPLQKQPLDNDPGYAHDDGRNDDGAPIAQSGIEQQQVGGAGSQHVLTAVGEVDDDEHAEDDDEPQAEKRVERAVDESDQQLAEQGLRADAEQFEHG